MDAKEAFEALQNIAADELEKVRQKGEAFSTSGETGRVREMASRAGRIQTVQKAVLDLQQLWGQIRRAVEDFLFAQWQGGALLGSKPAEAFFVRCDRTTMTQNDLDNGRLVCLIGVAPVKPAEFVIFRIGQWTADARQ